MFNLRSSLPALSLVTLLAASALSTGCSSSDDGAGGSRPSSTERSAVDARAACSHVASICGGSDASKTSECEAQLADGKTPASVVACMAKAATCAGISTCAFAALSDAVGDAGLGAGFGPATNGAADDGAPAANADGSGSPCDNVNALCNRGAAGATEVVCGFSTSGGADPVADCARTAATCDAAIACTKDGRKTGLSIDPMGPTGVSFSFE